MNENLNETVAANLCGKLSVINNFQAVFTDMFGTTTQPRQPDYCDPNTLKQLNLLRDTALQVQGSIPVITSILQEQCSNIVISEKFRDT